MARKTAHLPVEQIHLLSGFGERLRLLRMRQRLTAKQVAAAAGMSVMTLRSLERGGSGVTMGAYLAVMGVLGIERDLEALGAAAFAGVAAVEDSPHRCAEGGAVSVSAPQATPSDDDSPNAGEVCDGMVAADRAADIEARVVLPVDQVASQEPFDWLEAPAQDLQQLMRSVVAEGSRTVVGPGGSGELRDLFDDPAAEA
jgi:transcriptional regulator with XRE-family HTH domain